MLTALLAVLLHLFTQPAEAATHVEHPVWLGGELAGGSGAGASSAPGGGVEGLIGVALGKPSHTLGLEGRIGESVYAGDLRTVGNIDFDVRYPGGSGPFAYVGFAHHHELPIDEAIAHPGGAIAATYGGITHRTGFEIGGGWDVATPFPNSKFGSRLRPTARVSVTVLPDAVSPPVYITGNIGVLIGVGKAR